MLRQHRPGSRVDAVLQSFNRTGVTLGAERQTPVEEVWAAAAEVHSVAAREAAWPISAAGTPEQAP